MSTRLTPEERAYGEASKAKFPPMSEEKKAEMKRRGRLLAQELCQNIREAGEAKKEK